MRKQSFLFKSIALSLFLFITLTACQKEEQQNQVDYAPQVPVAKTYKAKVMQQTTSVIVSMLNENPILFNDINEAIKSDAVEYMEDRILFVDLFKNPQLAKSVEEQRNLSTFSSEFKKHASSNIQYAPANGQNQTPTLDADALMQYLIDNNISVYCPFPLEDYAEDNRIPAIAANIGEEYEELPGIQFHADGSYDSVMVSQTYADLHPVWLINPEEEYIFNINRTNNKQNITIPDTIKPLDPGIISPVTPYYTEVKFNSIFITDYMGTLAGGDLEVYLCKTNSTPTYNNTTRTYSSSLSEQEPHIIPRKYVRYAKNGKTTGWVNINYIFEQNWSSSEKALFFVAYEYDQNTETKSIESSNTFSDNSGTYTFNAEFETRTKDEIMAQKLIERTWIFDIISNNSSSSWTDENGINQTKAPDGYNIFQTAGFVKFSVTKRQYQQ